MVYLKRFTFKLGINPSQASQFNYNNLAPIQRLMLARCRIFQTTLNSQLRTGIRGSAAVYNADIKHAAYAIPLNKVKLLGDPGSFVQSKH